MFYYCVSEKHFEIVRPDMTSAVYCGRKGRNETNKQTSKLPSFVFETGIIAAKARGYDVGIARN